MQFYDPISKVIKTDYAEAIEAWKKAGNQITELPSYTQACKASHHINNDEQKVTRNQIIQFNLWLAAKSGRITKFRKLVIISDKYFSNIRRHLSPCKNGLFRKFEEAMAIIEQGEKK